MWNGTSDLQIHAFVAKYSRAGQQTVSLSVISRTEHSCVALYLLPFPLILKPMGKTWMRYTQMWAAKSYKLSISFLPGFLRFYIKVFPKKNPVIFSPPLLWKTIMNSKWRFFVRQLAYIYAAHASCISASLRLKMCVENLLAHISSSSRLHGGKLKVLVKGPLSFFTSSIRHLWNRAIRSGCVMRHWNA